MSNELDQVKKELSDVKYRLGEAEELLECAIDLLDNTHGYNYDLYDEIKDFLHGED